MKLNIVTGRLTKVTECPEPMMAHQVIYLPATQKSPKGTVYCFGGLASSFAYQPQCFKYDVARNAWSSIDDLEGFRLSFNLLPLINNRYILLISQEDHLMLDTKTDRWI